MKKILVVSAALAAAGLATPALAQDASGAPGGLYVGALAGYQGLDVTAQDGTATAKADSAVYGINGGYDLNLGNLFVGIEGEYSASGGSAEFPDSFAGARDGLEANGQYYVGGRVGVALTPGIAAYGKIGYTALDTRAFTSAGTLDDVEENANGLRYGAGVQVQLPGALEARLEYRRSQYKNLDTGGFDDATTNQLVAGVGLRF